LRRPAGDTGDRLLILPAGEYTLVASATAQNGGTPLKSQADPHVYVTDWATARSYFVEDHAQSGSYLVDDSFRWCLAIAHDDYLSLLDPEGLFGRRGSKRRTAVQPPKRSKNLCREKARNERRLGPASA
jgi:hypothetical protein